MLSRRRLRPISLSMLLPRCELDCKLERRSTIALRRSRWPTISDGFDKQRKCWRGLPPAWVEQMIAREGWTPLRENPDQLSAGQIGSDGSLARTARDTSGRRLICPTGSSAHLLSSPAAKNILLYRSLKSLLCFPPSRPDERGVRVVTDVGCGMRWMRRRQETNDAERIRRSRVVLTPRRWRQVGDDAGASRK
jgi:hypothetical protein